MKSKTSLQCIIILLEHYFSIDRRRFSSINYALYCKLSQGVHEIHPWTLLTIGFHGYAYPQNKFGNAHKPLWFSSPTRLNQADYSSLVLVFMIDSLLQERQQTLAAHKDSPLYRLLELPPVTEVELSTDKRGFFQCLQVWSHLCLSWILQQPIDHWIPHMEKGYRKNTPKVLREDRLHLRDVPNPCLGATPTSTHQRPTKRTTYRGYGVLLPDLIQCYHIKPPSEVDWHSSHR
jgi:hypothetical protein